MRPTGQPTSLFTEWPKTDMVAGEYSSPPVDENQPEDKNVQVLMFENRIKDGSISASVTPINGLKDKVHGHLLRECNFLFRWKDRNSYYAAGIGGYGRKFFIAKAIEGGWQLLDAMGLAGELNTNETYHLKVEFFGDRLTLFSSNVPVASTIDGTYFYGNCGLRTHRTEAKFANVAIQAVMPKCFVIMPFASELRFVFQVIEETVRQHGINCMRADQRYVSEPIMEDVKSQIASAELVIVDFTNRNPNVYYEAGLADAWKKKWIVIAQSRDDLAFDVQHIRTIIYSNTMGGDRKLREDLEFALKELFGSVEEKT